MCDHKEIWLMPECCADPAEGRLWCEQDEPTSCEDGVPWTRYVRADLHDALAARLAEAERDLAITREALAATQDALDAKNQVDRTDADRASDSATGSK